MKTKLEDVAKSAGVSLATVSRVLNNHPVRESTRKSVEQAIEKLHYRPNLAARSLTQKRTKTIGVVASSLVNPYHAILIDEIESTIRSAGYLCIIGSSGDNPENEAEIILSMLDSQVDGIIVAEATPLNTNNGFYKEVNRSVPVVLINGNPEFNEINHVIVDQNKGMHTALEHLFSLGHSRIVLLRGRSSPSYDIKEQVYRQLLHTRGFEIYPQYIINIKEANQINAISEVSEALRVLLSSDSPKPTAVFASNEFLAAGVLQACCMLGISIPHDISLIAQDNTYISSITNPSITVINMKMSSVGRACATMLLQLLQESAPEARLLVFYPELIIRNSTKDISSM